MPRKRKTLDALAAAAQIVANAREMSIEIDWSQAPTTVSDYERALRLAVIRRIEIEHMAGFCGGPSSVYNALDDLCPDDERPIGADLYDALELWDARRKAEWTERKRQERLDLYARARADLDVTAGKVR